MKKGVLCFAVLAILLIALVVVSAQTPRSGNPSYKIGVDNALTGGISVYALDFQKGIEFAVEEINAKGGINGRRIELVVRDDESDPVHTANNVRALAQAGCLAMVGGAGFGLQNAVAPVVEEVKLPCVILAPIDPPYVEPGGYCFGGIWYTTEKIALARVRTCAEYGLRKMALLISKEQAGEAQGKAWKKAAAPEEGVELVGIEWMLLTDTDVTPQLIKLRATKPDAIGNISGGKAAVVQYKSLLRLGWKIPMITIDSNTTPSFIEAMGEDADIVLAWAPTTAFRPDSIPATDPTRAEVISFAKRYEAKTGKVFGSMVTQGYDAMRSLFPVLEKTRPDPAKEELQAMRDRIRNELENQCFQGLDWKICRTPKDHKGAQDPKAYKSIAKVEGKQFVPVTKADLAKYR